MTTDDTRPAQTMPIRGYPTWIGIPKKEYERHAALESALDEAVGWLENEAEYPRAEPAPSMRMLAARLRAILDGEPDAHA